MSAPPLRRRHPVRTALAAAVVVALTPFLWLTVLMGRTEDR